MSKLSEFYGISKDSTEKVPQERADRLYKSLRFQTFLAGTIGYSLYYVCRTSLNVMKQPIIDSGLLSPEQLGIIGACLYWAYAVGKFVNGFLADRSNIKRFMATGLAISAIMNMMMGIIDFSGSLASISGLAICIIFSIMWGINGWTQSMGAPPAIIGLSRWFPLKIRGTFYGFFSASHNLGEGLSFILVGQVVMFAGWQWGFFGAAFAGLCGVLTIIFLMHDTPESKGLPSIEMLSGESQENKQDTDKEEAGKMQIAVLKNPGVWIIAISSAFMYMSRYAINEWGMFFLQKMKGFTLEEASIIIGINTILGVIGTVFSGWISDKVFSGDRKIPAFLAGILETLALILFLFGGNSWFVNILAMVLFGVSIGVLICFVGGLMAVDLVPRKATGAALGVVGMASYAAAGIQNIVSGYLIGGNGTSFVDNGVENVSYDFLPVSIFWIGSAAISFLLPILNWKRKSKEL